MGCNTSSPSSQSPESHSDAPIDLPPVGSRGVPSRYSLHRNDKRLPAFKPKYRLIRGDAAELGSGAFSVVRKCEDRKTKTVLAVKCIVKDWMKEQDRVNLCKEVEMLEMLNHPNIVQLVDFCEDDEFYYVVQEYCAGGPLCGRLCMLHLGDNSYNESMPQAAMKTLLKATQYFHSQGVVHRDLKPENILMESLETSCSTTIKIADFGLAAITDTSSQVLHTPVGTPNFVAPEVITGKRYGKAVDLWSLGTIMYMLLCGYPPFLSGSQAELFRRIATADYTFDPADWSEVSSEARDLIRKLLVVNPEERYTAEQALAHPWFSDETTEKLRSRRLTAMTTLAGIGRRDYKSKSHRSRGASISARVMQLAMTPSGGITNAESATMSSEGSRAANTPSIPASAPAVPSHSGSTGAGGPYAHELESKNQDQDESKLPESKSPPHDDDGEVIDPTLENIGPSPILSQGTTEGRMATPTANA